MKQDPKSYENTAKVPNELLAKFIRMYTLKISGTQMKRRSAYIVQYDKLPKVNHRKRGFCVFCMDFCGYDGDVCVCEHDTCQQELHYQEHPEDYVNQDGEDK